MLYYVLNQLGEALGIHLKRQMAYAVYRENPERLYELLSHREKEFENNPARKRNYSELKTNTACRKASGRENFEGIEEYRKALEDIIIPSRK